MTLEEVYEFYGSTKALCDAIGIKRQSLTYWRHKRCIPLRTQLHIAVITKGKLIANKDRFNKYSMEIISPIFKYNDKKYGLCEVESIYFTKGNPPKIVYVSPKNNKKKFTVFNAKNLVINR
jgi:hypothetical protein